MKNKTVKALATLLAITTVSMMGTAGVMASDNTAEDTATEAAADTAWRGDPYGTSCDDPRFLKVLFHHALAEQPAQHGARPKSPP